MAAGRRQRPRKRGRNLTLAELIAELSPSEAEKLLAYPPHVITGILEARGRLDARDRKVRLHDAYLAAHPGKDGKALLKLMKALERASKPPLTLEEQANEQLAAAMQHLLPGGL